MGEWRSPHLMISGKLWRGKGVCTKSVGPTQFRMRFQSVLLLSVSMTWFQTQRLLLRLYYLHVATGHHVIHHGIESFLSCNFEIDQIGAFIIHLTSTCCYQINSQSSSYSRESSDSPASTLSRWPSCHLCIASTRTACCSS